MVLGNESHDNPEKEKTLLSGHFWSVYTGAKVAAVLGLLLTILLGVFERDGFRRFYFAYLVSFIYFLTLCIGGLFFVLTQHVSRAGWSVTVRRVAEIFAATMPIMAALSAPILVSVVLERGDLYRWALPMSAASEEVQKIVKAGNADEPTADEIKPPAPALIAVQDGSGGAESEPFPPAGERKIDALMFAKRSWLNPGFFVLRAILYFAIWSAMGVWYWKQSILQDDTGDVKITVKLQRPSGFLLVVLGLTVTGAAFDWVMSLDPHWFSTIFGVYIFAGSAISVFASMIVIFRILQAEGYLKSSVDTEHFHDLGKYLFAFVFFWGYIAFSQYMLLWYANLPETVRWLSRRGATTAPNHVNGWSALILILLFCHLLIPFGGLLSRHIKRKAGTLLFWAIWLLVFHYLDLYWLIMPEYGPGFHPLSIAMDISAFVGIGGVFLATIIRLGSHHSLRPTHDPRLAESLAFHNF